MQKNLKIEPDVDMILKSEGVKSEEELEKKMLNNWLDVRCFRCRKVVSLLNCVFINDLPVCNSPDCRD